MTIEVENAAIEMNPAKITKYAIDLATLFHKFYNAHRVDIENQDVMQARLFLCICVRDVMKNVLDMLKVEAPEIM